MKKKIICLGLLFPSFLFSSVTLESIAQRIDALEILIVRMQTHIKHTEKEIQRLTTIYEKRSKRLAEAQERQDRELQTLAKNQQTLFDNMAAITTKLERISEQTNTRIDTLEQLIELRFQAITAFCRSSLHRSQTEVLAEESTEHEPKAGAAAAAMISARKKGQHTFED